ncbi:hypothetical protein [Actinomycetospora termitidis]|uniref:Uncharacterized protein n=1 Tax=Actinomycetospora termitidis TaxID=3053470 RepID=A0ABT7MG25_9PSEU|nr:hypothetical protein [Actinomycetospora sp. Odt1-22]MDL5159401.1 hypothetical protein [Actinomycetospora sp. Odt1-22]
MTAPTDTTVPQDPTAPSPDGAQAVAPDAATSSPAAPDPAGAPAPEQPPAAPEPVTAPTAEQPKTEDGDEGDLPTILPDPATLTVAGIPARVRRINLRELMLLAQVVSAGLGSNLARLDFANMTDEKMIGLALIALPEAGPELTAFTRAVVEARDPAQHNELTAAVENPAIEDFLNIAGVLIVQEKDEFARLGKHLQQMVRGLQALWRTGKRGT